MFEGSHGAIPEGIHGRLSQVLGKILEKFKEKFLLENIRFFLKHTTFTEESL